MVLAALRAPYRGRCTPVNAWWGSFDLAVNLFSGRRRIRRRDDFIMRNAMNVQEVAVGWWPGDTRYARPRSTRTLTRRRKAFPAATLSPAAAHWDTTLGEYILDWDDVCASPDPHGTALEFARSAARHACAVCQWDPLLAGSVEGKPPPIV